MFLLVKSKTEKENLYVKWENVKWGKEITGKWLAGAINDAHLLSTLSSTADRHINGWTDRQTYELTKDRRKTVQHVKYLFVFFFFCFLLFNAIFLFVTFCFSFFFLPLLLLFFLFCQLASAAFAYCCYLQLLLLLQ